MVVIAIIDSTIYLSGFDLAVIVDFVSGLSVPWRVHHIEYELLLTHEALVYNNHRYIVSICFSVSIRIFEFIKTRGNSANYS